MGLFRVYYTQMYVNHGHSVITITPLTRTITWYNLIHHYFFLVIKTENKSLRMERLRVYTHQLIVKKENDL